MNGLEVGARVSEYDQEAIPRNNRDGGSAWIGKRVYGTITAIKEHSVKILWDKTDWWDLGELDHHIEEIGMNIRIEELAAEQVA